MQKPIWIEIGEQRWQLDLWQLIFLVDSVKKDICLESDLLEQVEEGAY